MGLDADPARREELLAEIVELEDKHFGILHARMSQLIGALWPVIKTVELVSIKGIISSGTESTPSLSPTSAEAAPADWTVPQATEVGKTTSKADSRTTADTVTEPNYPKLINHSESIYSPNKHLFALHTMR